jgi:hypothetical protein
MNKAIARLNIEHFRKCLSEEADESKREVLRRLLADEEAKLALPLDPVGEKVEKA